MFRTIWIQTPGAFLKDLGHFDVGIRDYIHQIFSKRWEGTLVIEQIIPEHSNPFFNVKFQQRNQTTKHTKTQLILSYIYTYPFNKTSLIFVHQLPTNQGFRYPPTNFPNTQRFDPTKTHTSSTDRNSNWLGWFFVGFGGPGWGRAQGEWLDGRESCWVLLLESNFWLGQLVCYRNGTIN